MDIKRIFNESYNFLIKNKDKLSDDDKRKLEDLEVVLNLIGYKV